MEVAADHPGRQAFCAAYAGDPSADSTGACLADNPWYFHGRPFGSSGPARRVRRDSRTQRVAASLDGDFSTGGRDAPLGCRPQLFAGAGQLRRAGDLQGPDLPRLPRLRRSRLGVGVSADRTSPAGMRLEHRAGAAAGQGPLHVLQLEGTSRHHGAPHRCLRHLGRELPVALPRQRDDPDSPRAEPDRTDPRLGQRRAVLRRLHARSEGPPDQDGAEMALRRSACRPPAASLTGSRNHRVDVAGRSQGSRSSTTICASGRASGATRSPAPWWVRLW